MEDSRQIENLIYTYAERIDNGDLAGVAELFRDAKIVSTSHGVEFVGYEQVLELYRLSCRLYEPSGTPLTKHLTTNVIIEVHEGGTSAVARSYYTVIQATDSFALQPVISGKYRDSFRKQGPSWKFSEREMFVDLIGDCSAHLLYDSSAL